MLKKEKKEKIAQEIKEYMDYRKERHPKEPSAGSVFKNKNLDSRLRAQIKKLKIKNKKLLKEFPELEEFNKKGMIPAGWLIKQCGLRGRKIGGAQISQLHPNFILNLGSARAKDILELINLVKKAVKNKFGIKLEEEVQFLGFEK